MGGYFFLRLSVTLANGDIDPIFPYVSKFSLMAEIVPPTIAFITIEC